MKEQAGSNPMSIFHDMHAFAARARARLSADAPRLDGGLRPAAVLVPVIDRHPVPTVLLTMRPLSMPHHAGQVSFPGGVMERGETPMRAALREAREETGLAPEMADPLGFLPARPTGTGFCVAPLVARIDPSFAPIPCPREVEEVFEIPLPDLMNPDGHAREYIHTRDGMRVYWVMRHDGRRVWGATAAMLRALWERLS